MPLRPGEVRPMLALAAPYPFDSPRHLFEPKWDGYRCLAFVEAGATRLQSRNLRDITADFPALGDLHRYLAARRAVVDGEITAWEGGVPSFSALQARAGQLVFVAFDILELEGRELLDCPLEERRETLERVITGGLPGPCLVLSPVVPERGRDLFAKAAGMGLEGVVAKERGSPYLPGQRSRYWIKVKVRRSADCVVVGYRLSPGGGLGSLVLAVPGPEGWRVVGHVGTGWDERTGNRILSLLHPGPPPAHVPREFRRGVNWVEAEVVCSVAYLEITRDGLLRHTSFLGLRCDLSPREAGFERPVATQPGSGARDERERGDVKGGGTEDERERGES